MANPEVTLQVEYHPSGNYTLTEKSGSGHFPSDGKGALFGNGDKGEFYRAVAQRLAELSQADKRVVYRDTSDDNSN